MPDFPSLEPKKKSSVVPIGIAAMAVGLLAGGGYWFFHRGEEPPAPGPSPSDTPRPAPTASDTPAPPVSPAPPPAPSPVHAFTVAIEGPLESAIISSVGKDEGTALTQVVTRVLVWWLRVPQDLVKGDTLSVVYETRDGQEPLVSAVRLVSRKLNRTVEAFHFRPQGSPFAHFYMADGAELEEHLVDGPLDSYEQITSLLRDGRRHRGVDFKTPVGTPVKATFDGVVTRRTWNFRSNGNSLEIQESGGQGRKAMFLHLSEIPSTMRPGRAIKKGEVIAKSGNTGHSFAPHLHYQLMKNEAVIDPFTSHRTARGSLTPTERPTFDQEASRLRALFPPVTG